jgi:sulfite exporter TauE/SafE
MIITIAFLGSIGHCTGMCGGFVIAYTSAKISEKWRKTYSALAHFLYNIGRVSSYVMLGIIFGYIGSVVSVSMETKGFLFLFVGIVMILMGLSLLGQLKFLNKIEFSIDSSNFFKKSFAKLMASESLISFYFLGMLNGFIPCGFTYFFLAVAIATTSIVDGALVMLLFGLSTVPILFSLGFVVGFLKQSKFRNIMMKLASISIILFGLFTGFKAMMLINGQMPMKKNSAMNIENFFTHEK